MVVRVVPAGDRRMVTGNLKFVGVAIATRNLSEDVVYLWRDVQTMEMEIGRLVQFVREREVNCVTRSGF